MVCVDLQERMIRSLRKRAARAGVAERIETRLCSEHGLGIGDLAGSVDFALAFAMVHEVPDAAGLLSELHEALVAGGRLLIAEPKGHVSEGALAETVATAERAGFAIVGRPTIRGSHTALVERPR